MSKPPAPPTADDVLFYIETHEVGYGPTRRKPTLAEAERAVWKRWRLASIEDLRQSPHNVQDDDAQQLLDILVSIERALQ